MKQTTPTPDWAKQKIAEAKVAQAKKLNLDGYGKDERLQHVPPELAELTQLEILNLRHTNLSELPEFLGQLTNLTQLDLS
ncbi:hypothetical protein QUF58_04130, partial [Anaerolineales bacterium HSG24]|nr:hypothetical protein [Anaerolineales bacterium HSG24]